MRTGECANSSDRSRRGIRTFVHPRIKLASLSQLNHFTVPDIIPVDAEAYDCSHDMPALVAGGAWIDVKALQFVVVNNF